MRERALGEAPSLVVCVGKKCAPREQSRALADEARDYAATRDPAVRLVVVGCLHVCEKGPIAATWPKVKFHKRVDAEKARALIDKLAARARRDA